MLSHYKEVWYGIAIGISMWVLDALMHASMHGRLSWHSFINEFSLNDITQLFFRSLFVIVATAFGFTLWRSNQRKCQVNDLQEVINSLHSQVVSPLLLIVGYTRLLSVKEGWPVSREEIEMIREIQLNAEKINRAIKALPPPGIPLEQINKADLIVDKI
ncbi:MAG: hypothetical protein AB1489_23940 [Acidobacteriota bacterium]